MYSVPSQGHVSAVSRLSSILLVGTARAEVEQRRVLA